MCQFAAALVAAVASAAAAAGDADPDADAGERTPFRLLRRRPSVLTEIILTSWRQ